MKRPSMHSRCATVLVAVLAITVVHADRPAAASGGTSRLAFATSTHRHIHVVDAATADDRTVVHAGTDHVVLDPSWSPDGRHLAYGDTLAVVEPLVGELRTVDVERRRARTVLTLPTLFVSATAWSPRGDRIAFSASTVYPPVWGLTYSQPSVHVVDVDGGNHLVLGAGTDPVWSPDGRRIAFDGPSNIVVVTPDDPTKVTIVGQPDTPTANPRWSPDGRLLAYTTSSLALTLAGLAPMISVARVDGSDVSHLRAFTYAAPTWSADSTHLAYIDRGVVVIDVRSGIRRRLTLDEDHGTWAPSWSSTAGIAVTRDYSVQLIDPVTGQHRVLARIDPSRRLAWSR